MHTTQRNRGLLLRTCSPGASILCHTVQCPGWSLVSVVQGSSFCATLSNVQDGVWSVLSRCQHSVTHCPMSRMESGQCCPGVIILCHATLFTVQDGVWSVLSRGHHSVPCHTVHCPGWSLVSAAQKPAFCDTLFRIRPAQCCPGVSMLRDIVHCPGSVWSVLSGGHHAARHCPLSRIRSAQTCEAVSLLCHSVHCRELDLVGAMPNCPLSRISLVSAYYTTQQRSPPTYMQSRGLHSVPHFPQLRNLHKIRYLL